MKPARDPKYLKAIRSMRCVLDHTGECRGSVEAAHTGAHGLGQKASDYRAIPLCAEHHRNGRYSIHAGRRAFEAHYGIDVEHGAHLCESTSTI
jgi:hypothetical protein